MSRNEPAIEIWSDDYWSPEEREAWDAAIERNIAQRPPRPLRRATRPVKVGGRFRIVGRTAPIPADDPFAPEEE
jgi:hypothetical protein